MKVKSAFAFIALLCLNVSLLGQDSNFEIVDQLSYDLLTKRYLKLPPNLSLDELSLPEKLSTKTILFEEEISLYQDDDDNFVKESIYRNQINLYPNWYLLPDLILYSSRGTEQIFTSKSSLFSGGWFGHREAVKRRGVDQSNERMKFYEDSWQNKDKTGRFITSFDEQESMQYSTQNQDYQENGFLPYFVPLLIQQQPIDESEYSEFGDLQYREGPGFEQLYSPKICITWYSELGLEEILFYENGELTRILKKEFDYDAVNAMFLLNRVKETKREILSTGDCYERVEERFYSNYSFDRSNVEPRVDGKELIKLNLYPNPTSKELNVDLEKLNVKGVDFEYIVFDNNGLSMVKGNLNKFSEGKLSINVERFPAGTYHFLLQYEEELLRASFVKN